MPTIKPLEYTLQVKSEIARVYRVFNSQHELRKWFMPSVILSKKTVLDMHKRRIYFQKMSFLPNVFIRYHWRPIDWPKKKEATILTFTLTDHSLDRNAEQDGILVEVSHDRWPNEMERDAQGKLWPKMLENLKAVIAEETINPWWKQSSSKPDTQVILLRELKSILLMWSRSIDFPFNRNLVNLCEKIDRENSWHMEKKEKVSYRIDGKEIFSLFPNFFVDFQWKTIESLCQHQFPHLLERFNVEQDQLIDPMTATSLDLRSLEFSLLINWIQDLIATVTDS